VELGRLGLCEGWDWDWDGNGDGDRNELWLYGTRDSVFDEYDWVR